MKLHLKTALLLGLLTTIAAQAAQRPNIIFIEVDDLNYKYSDVEGSNLLDTPNMDRLAKSGTYFKNAMCQGMMCGPSRNSLISGLYPHNMGFYRNGQLRTFPEGTWMFPQALQKAGYFTSYIGKSHIKGYKKGDLTKEQGFDHIQHTAGRAVLLSKAKKGKQIKDWYFDYLNEEGLFDTLMEDHKKKQYSTLPEDAYLDGFFTKASIDFIEDYNAEKPLFMWINYSLPHGPHDVAKKYHTFKEKDMPGTQKANFEHPPKLIENARKAKPTMKKTQAEYCGAISFLDRQIGRVLEQLEKSKMLDNTIIVLFSDHGIMMGDHELIHKGTLFRQITTPTLVIAWPEQFKKGVVETAPVELLDLIPTALEVAGGEAYDTREYKATESLLPLLTGKGTFERKYAFGEVESYITVSDGHYRLIQGEGNNLLFDEINDPDNLTNIADKHPERVVELSKAIEAWIKKSGPIREAGFYKKKK